jgi:hypothetical protein
MHATYLLWMLGVDQTTGILIEAGACVVTGAALVWAFLRPRSDAVRPAEPARAKGAARLEHDHRPARKRRPRRGPLAHDGVAVTRRH